VVLLGASAVNNTGAEVWVHPSGKFLYGSNRGDDSIAVFALDGASRMS
jgi:6-phosphogluconolactonase